MFVDMDEILTWADVAKRLSVKPRGAQGRLAKQLGRDPSQFSRMLRSRGELTLKQQRQIETLLESEADTDLAAEEPDTPPPGALQVYGYAATTDGDRIAIASDRLLDHMTLLPGIDLDPEVYFVVLPIGSSMEPRIFAGEPQVVRRRYPPRRDQKCLIEFNDGSAVIKHYRGQKDGRVFAEQFNPPRVIDYPATEVRAIHAICMAL